MAGGELFGTAPGGEEVRRVEIAGGGLRAAILTYGATLQDLHLEGHPAPLVLGFPELADYLEYATFFGAVVGRYANRIAGGRFMIDGQRFQADTNDGANMLHGGSDGFWHRLWTLREHGEDFVTLALHDMDGAMGFPGAVDVSLTYRLRQPGTLALEIEASCDEPTLVNLAHHSYFNLDDGGAGDVLGHRVMLPAGAYLPVDGESIPTGVVQPVDGTDFDFRHARAIRRGADGAQVPYDHNFCVAAERGPMRQHAWVQGGSSGVEMEVWSSEPGLQFYIGHKIEPGPAGNIGAPYSAFAGFAMEPQVWPDSPNRSYFPQAVLRPGETYRQQTEYRFRLD